MAVSNRGWVRGPCLGRGSTAAVYLAASTSGERQSFAVKSTELPRSAPLQREENILSSLCSPHVVSCFGCDVTEEADGRVLYNLFLEYVPGGSLAEAIKRQGSLDEPTIRLYTRGILHGLAYLQSRGIVHCDVKGHNILLGDDERHVVKLADLGCARWVDGSDDRRVIGGTPLYMAPEVARGEEQGPAADVWALGCTVIEMATGCPPWRDVTDPVAAVHRIAFSADVPEFPCNISGEARDFLFRCLNRDPGKRWSAEELLHHPFVNCVQESAGGCATDLKRSSPKSTLDQVFWDSWQEEDEDEARRQSLDNQQPLEHAQERLRQLVAVAVSSPPAANATWDESCWVTVRNSQRSENQLTVEEDKPSTSGSWVVEEAGDGIGGTEEEEESASYSDYTGVGTEGHLPCNVPSLHPLVVDDVNIICSSRVSEVDEAEDVVGTQSFEDRDYDFDTRNYGGP